jgi:arylsulfatase
MQLSREWGAMVLKLDNFVGNLIEYLKENGEYENTIVFFASDNGYSMSGYTDRGNAPYWPDDPWLKNKGPFTGGKFSVLEGGCRIPFFVNWPGKIKPAVFDDPVWLPDFFPTAAELAGADVSDIILDATSLIPIINGDTETFVPHDYLYFSKNREQALRMGEWKAYRKSPDAPTELYKVEEDTYTENNLANQHPEIVSKMNQIMDTEYTPHEWYWNPNESFQDYQKKKEKAVKTGNVLPAFRPNGIELFPWEK